MSRGGLERDVIDLNETGLSTLSSDKKLLILSGADHLFEKPGALDAAIAHAARYRTNRSVSMVSISIIRAPPLQRCWLNSTGWSLQWLSWPESDTPALSP